MSSHDGSEVVGSELVARACGHMQSFLHYKGEKFRAERRAKFQKKRCPPCGVAANKAHNEEQRLLTGGKDKKVKKGSEVKMLPSGTTVQLVFDGVRWKGTLGAGDVYVQADMAGAMGVLSKLARRWLQETGKKVEGKVQ